MIIKCKQSDMYFCSIHTSYVGTLDKNKSLKMASPVGYLCDQLLEVHQT